MSGEIPAEVYETLCRLLAAWVHDAPWEQTQTPDYEALFAAADRHRLTAAACLALEHAGLMDRCPAETAGLFQAERVRSIRKTLLMDAEREKLLAFLEQSGVWYAPLKGTALNRLYPQYGVRQFADNDILFDAARWREVRDHMKSRGYKAKSVGRGIHDAYTRPPVYYFELHRALFQDDGGDFSAVAAAYYENVRERLVRDRENGFGYHFTDEDLYVYFLAHAYKHFQEGGTGLRTVLDVYLYRRARPDMDGRYIADELEKLGLTAFEELFRGLGGKLFGPKAAALTEPEAEALRWIESSGVYGTIRHAVRSDMRRLQGDGGAAGGRARYLLRRVFPPMEWYRCYVPFVYRHRWVLPFYWVYRLGRGVFANGQRNLKMLAAAMDRTEEDAGEAPPR